MHKSTTGKGTEKASEFNEKNKEYSTKSDIRHNKSSSNKSDIRNIKKKTIKYIFEI